MSTVRKRIDDVQWYELTKGDYEIGLDFFDDGDMPCLARTREAAASFGKVLTEHLGEDGRQVVPGDWNVQRFDLTGCPMFAEYGSARRYRVWRRNEGRW